jgi:PhnB protein
MQFINYLGFDGTCEEAFNFYAKVFKKEITAMFRNEDMPPGGPPVPEEAKKRVMHASLKVADNAVLMGGDAPIGMFKGHSGFCINIAIKDTDEATRIFDELANGGKTQMPLAQTFWAKLFGMCIDKYGVPWMVNVE